jgi:HNH endonuclease
MARLVCPYCTREIEMVSRDHIFPDFLGGTRTIPACATCNNKIFGSRFESKSARQLLAFQLMLSSLGLSRISLKEGTRWVRAYEQDGELYDVEFRRGRPVLVLSKPKITRDELGRVVSVRARSVDEARALGRRVGGKAGGVIQEVFLPIAFGAREFAFEFGPDFGRLVLKMCAAVSTLIPGFDPEDIRPLVSVLKGDELRVDDARKDFRPCPAVDSAVPLLSHAIYVERNPTGLHGLVVLFGAIRMYCKMASMTHCTQSSALLAILDISTGAERFSQVAPQGLAEAPLVIQSRARDDGIDRWMVELQRQISKAGAAGWSVSAHVPPRPISELWQSSTSDMSFNSWSRSTLSDALLRSESKKE